MRRTALAFGVGCASGVGAAFALAVILAVVDLYRTGHGDPPLGRPWLQQPGLGVDLSRADVILLAGTAIAAVGAAALTWAGGTRTTDGGGA